MTFKYGVVIVGASYGGDASGAVGDADRLALKQHIGKTLAWPTATMNRAETAVWLWQQLGLPT